jgi:predicted nucleic acid-binding protein
LSRVVDSSAWIEWLINGRSAPELATRIPRPEDCIVPTMVQYELSKWLTREVGEEQADDFIAFTGECVVVHLDTRIALMAAEMSRLHKLTAADAIIYATAIQKNADLLTCDAHFAGLPHVVYLAKTPN